jgi:cbb3-type cytochrome oxidase maturation protein
MDILFLLIPLSVLLVGAIAWAFLWSVRHGQFDDMEGPGHQILFDDDSAPDARDTRQQIPRQVHSA